VPITAAAGPDAEMTPPLDLVHPADRFGALRSGHACKARDGKQAESGPEDRGAGQGSGAPAL
jgi:hypothetical protein